MTTSGLNMVKVEVILFKRTFFRMKLIQLKAIVRQMKPIMIRWIDIFC